MVMVMLVMLAILRLKKYGCGEAEDTDNNGELG